VETEKQIPQKEIDISSLISSLQQRVKAQVVKDALETFLPAQEAYLLARKQLFTTWKQNGSPFGWSFPPVPILNREGLTYQSFRNIF
jgi:hypothetical protein